MKKTIISASWVLSSVFFITTAYAQTAVPTLLSDGDATSECISFTTQVLRLGSRDANTNDEVTILQDFLISKGVLSGQTTGYYGRLTVQAVRAYQKSVGVSPTGNVGALTKSIISKETCNGSTVPTTPVSYAPTTPGAYPSASPVQQLPSAAPRMTSFTSSGSPLLRMKYDTTNKESWLEAMYMIDVKAGGKDVSIVKPNRSVTQGDYYVSVGLSNNINYYGMTAMTASSNVIDAGDRYIVKAGQNASITVTQSYDPKRMFAGIYATSLSVAEYTGSVTATILSGVMSNYVTVVGESAAPKISSYSLVGLPLFTMKYDSANKESSLVAQYSVKIGAGDTDIIISKPNYSIPAGTNYFSVSLTKDINYYGVPSVNVSGGAVDYGDRIIVKAGDVAYLTVTQTYDPKRMFAGLYAAQLTFATFDGTSAQALLSGTTNYLTVVGEASVQAQAVTTSRPMVLGASTMCVDIPQNIHRGDESNNTTLLQKFLKHNGFYIDDVTGFYGDNTIVAVKDFQASQNLTVTGMVYDQTRYVIKNMTCGGGI